MFLNFNNLGKAPNANTQTFRAPGSQESNTSSPNLLTVKSTASTDQGSSVDPEAGTDGERYADGDEGSSVDAEEGENLGTSVDPVSGKDVQSGASADVTTANVTTASNLSTATKPPIAPKPTTRTVDESSSVTKEQIGDSQGMVYINMT